VRRLNIVCLSFSAGSISENSENNHNQDSGKGDDDRDLYDCQQDPDEQYKLTQQGYNQEDQGHDSA